MATKREVDSAIRAAQRLTGSRTPQLQIIYTKLTGGKRSKGKTVSRVIRPYELRTLPGGTVLWATDRPHGAGTIHKFKISQIRSITPLPPHTFKPVWPVQVGRATDPPTK